VSDIELVQLEGGEHKAKVTFTIVDSVKIPSDSGAAIVTAGLLGTQFINIQEGPSIDNLLKPNGVIEDTQEAMILEDLIKAFGINKAEEASKTDGAAAK
jgi:phospholipid/cholesterol/gamma-HCH transport system substrate-binding protein